MKNLKRVLMVAAALVVGVITVFFFKAFVVDPSSEQWSQSRTLAAALANARSVSFVEFTPFYVVPESEPLVPGETIVTRQVILQRLNATPDQIARLRAATSKFLKHFSVVCKG